MITRRDFLQGATLASAGLINWNNAAERLDAVHV